MLKKSQRLSKKQFDEVMKSGRVTHSSLFLLRLVLGDADTRISAVAPVKIAKKAVDRIRIRRKIYLALKSVIGAVPNGVHAIVFAKTNVLPSENENIQKALQDLFSKAKVLVYSN